MLAATYSYDAWGNIIAGDDFSGMNIRAINPIRYRSYYYDVETSLYYLNSRYYDPETGRFINADDTQYLEPEVLDGINLYAYCGNNPVMGYDPEGTWDWGFIGKVALTVAVVAVCLTGVGVVAAAAATMIGATAVATTGIVTTAVGIAAVATTVSAVDGGMCAEESGVTFGMVLWQEE